MPNTLPTCPREDCTATIGDHWHDSLGYAAPCPHTPGAIHGRCYAQRPTPSPLDALLTAAGDAKRAHDRLCDLAETLVPESSPVKTADNPAPVVLPTVDEVEKAWRAVIARGERVRDAAQAVLDLIADRVTPWVPVEPDDIKVGNRVRLVTAQGDESIYTVTWRDQDWINGHDETRDTSFPHTWFIDPRTVPAEPEDPRVAVVVQWWRGSIEPVATDKDAARDLLARLDAARADR